MRKFILNRDVTKIECPWLSETFKRGEVVYEFLGPTYGCISESGLAITKDPEGGNPFHELPFTALKQIDILDG